MILFWYGLLATLFWIITGIYLQFNRGRVGFLTREADAPLSAEPSVAIIIAVRNEEAQLQQALQSVCRLNYSSYRIVVVDDRSTDRTPQILAEFARRHPSITLLTIDALPAGWLGKNHALYRGYLEADQEWLLFTDADVEFAPDALHKALGYALRRQLDHLTIMPDIWSRSGLLLSLLSTFKIMLELKLRPWALRDPGSTASMGVGAFNLIRRQAYEQAGTHQPIAMRPDDDLKLGELVKKAGLKQDALYGDGEIGLEWYPGVDAFVQGLMKNTFATFNYQLWRALGAAGATLAAFGLPLPLLLAAGGGAEKLLALVLLVSMVPLYVSRQAPAAKWWHALLVPVAGWLLTYIILRSAWLTLRQGGIYWRESFYPLSELRKNV
jgi:cellulose synthase/poly-beta-1,6-N-acetylglucosamine synthase-like glycosyltransferase